MFSYAMDEAEGVYVGLYTGATQEDADYERCISSMKKAEAAATAHGKSLVAILVNDPGTPTVPTSWRRKMADFNEGVKAPRYLLSIVTDSTIVRGVLTAINWMSPAKPGHERVAHATFDDAQRWIERRLGAPVGQLSSLLTEARRRAR